MEFKCYSSHIKGRKAVRNRSNFSVKMVEQVNAVLPSSHSDIQITINYRTITTENPLKLAE